MPANTAFIPFLIGVLECLAGGVYLWHGNIRLAVMWVSVGIANFALAGVK